MKRIRRRHIASLLALLFMALLAVVYVFSAQLLNDLVRPRLVTLAAAKLGAEVTIGRLTWQQGALRVEDLHLQRPNQYRLDIPRLRLELRVGDLWRRRLSALEIDSPALQLQATAPSPSAAGPPPASLPFTIGRLTLRGGRIDYRRPDRVLSLRRIEAELRYAQNYRFELQAVLGDAAGVPLQLAGQAAWRQGVELTLTRCLWGDRSLLAEPLAVTVPFDGEATGAGRLRLERFDRQAWEQLRAGLQLPELLPSGYEFLLRGVEFNFSLADGEPHLRLRLAEGRLYKEALNLPLNDVDVELRATADGWQGRGAFILAGEHAGELSGRWSDGILQGRLQLQVADPGAFKAQIFGGTAPTLAGSLQLVADVVLEKGALSVGFDVQGRGGPAGRKDSLLNLAPMRLRAELQSSAGELQGQARLQVSGRELLTVSGRPDRLKLQLLPCSWSRWQSLLGPRLRPQDLQGVEDLSGSALLKRRASGAWAVAARLAGRLVTLRNGLRADSLTARLRLAGDPQGPWSGSLDLDGRQLSRAGLVLQGLKGNARLRYQDGRLIVSALQGAVRLAGAESLGGRLSLAGSGFWQAGRWQAHLAPLQLQDLEWLSDDGLAGLTGGRILLRGQLAGRSGQPLRLDLRGELGAAEGLWGAYYADLSDLPLRVALNLSWASASRRLQAEQWSVELARIGTLHGNALLAPDALRLSGTLQIPQFAGEAREFLARLLADSRPALAEASLSGGLQVDFEAQRDTGWTLQGEARPWQLGFELPAAKLALRGLEGRLPFVLSSAGAQVAEVGLVRRGELRFEELQLGPAQLVAVPLPLSASLNGFALHRPLLVELAGGRLTAADLSFGHGAEGLQLTGQFAVDGVDLQRLTAELGVAPMKGRLDADLGRIRYRGGLVRSEGEALIDAFGGRLRIGSIGLDISNLAYPQLTADLDFQGIDLYQLTQTFAFGAMNGIVDGYVHDLRLFGTTPAKFSALLESRLEGRRNISVKALNNLSILSQGGLSAALSRGIYRFIDFYRYRKIGIACELERDVFHLRGTARPDSTRYLVHGGVLPPKIDIIAPPSAIAFSEMLKRLQRIERAD